MASNNRPEVSIIIVSWNTRELLQLCLEGLLRQTGVNLEIIVIDNNSQDGSSDMVRAAFPKTLCLTNTTNRGFAFANNQGLRIAKGEYAILVNPDIEFKQQDTLAQIILAHTRTGAGIIGPQLRNSNQSIQQSVRSDPTALSQALIASKLHILVPNASVLQHYYCSDFDYQKEQRVEQISGAFFSVSRNVIQHIGLLDEKFWIWFEEVDYCTRAKLKGFTIWYTPNATVTHHGGQSFQKMIPRRRHKEYSQSLLRYSKKYFSSFQVALIRVAIAFGRFLSLFTPQQQRLRSYTTKRP